MPFDMDTPQHPHLGDDALAFLQSLTAGSAEAQRARKAEAVRLALTDAMRTARDQAGMTQTQVAEELGVGQSWVSKLESDNRGHLVESVVRYLDAVGAELALSVRTDRGTLDVGYEVLLGEGGSRYRMRRVPTPALQWDESPYLFEQPRPLAA